MFKNHAYSLTITQSVYSALIIPTIMYMYMFNEIIQSNWKILALLKVHCNMYIDFCTCFYLEFH
jgi:hypothetical protein